MATLSGCWAFLETDLQKAIESHDAATVKRLLDAGAPLARSWSELVPPERLAIVKLEGTVPESIEILRLLVAATADPRAFVHQDFYTNCKRGPCYSPTTVEHVARSRSVEAVQVLIDAGLDLRSQGVTNALVYAIAEDDEAMPRFLVAAGADVNGWAKSGSNYYGVVSVLEAARRKKNQALVDFLVAKGAQ